MDNRFLHSGAVEKLLQVKQHILAEPNRLCMMDWVRKGPGLYDYRNGLVAFTGMVPLNPPCGTAACIGGWVCILNGAEENAGPAEAIKCLELSPLRYYDDFYDLFFTDHWDSDLQERFSTTDLRQRASAAAEQIDRFIKRHEIVA